MNNFKNNKHYSYRLKLEKLKFGVWMLIVLARLLAFLILVFNYK